MIQRITNCYDSHTHFLATGQVAAGLKLQDLRSSQDLKDLNILLSHYRGNWLTGFGWDQNHWPSGTLPHRQDLDLFFPDTPVLFSRVDGHASWLNNCAIDLLKTQGFDFKKESQQTGLLFEQDHIKALSLLPSYSPAQNKLFLQSAQKIFNQAGFTHVRDLSMNLETWKILLQMYEEKDLTVCLDSFVTVESVDQVEAVIQEILLMRQLPCPQLKVHGVKIFVDGSLGSKTAYLSENYFGSEQRGLFLWSAEQIMQAMQKTWSAGLDVAVHCIGDQAAHEVVQVSRQVSAQGLLGRLHLEHIEILRPETVQLMKPLHVTCYLQPSHWLSDHDWLAQVISPRLQKNIFQWQLLKKNKIPFYFGSDSPVEPVSLFDTQKALRQSEMAGVPALEDDWKKYQSHPDSKWTKSWTEFDDQKIMQVYFNERPLL